MGHPVITTVILFISAIHLIEKRQLKTCPGFPGYCSEAYPGGVCTVVCAFGRPNVPECQVRYGSFINHVDMAGGGGFAKCPYYYFKVLFSKFVR